MVLDDLIPRIISHHRFRHRAPSRHVRPPPSVSALSAFLMSPRAWRRGSDLLEGSFHLRRPVFFDDIVARQAVSRCGASCGPRVTSSASRVVGIVSRWRASGTRGTRVTRALECTLLVIREDIPVAVRHAQRVGGMPSVLPSARIADAREPYCRQPSPAVINRLPFVPLRPWVTPWSMVHDGVKGPLLKHRSPQ